MEELIKKVQDWANERGLNKPEQALNQFLKVNSEFGETCEAILHRPKNGDDDLIDGFGDIIVTFIVLCYMKDLQMKTIHYNPKNTKGANELYFGAFNTHLSSVYSALAHGSSWDLENVIDDAIDALFAFIADAGFTPEQCLQAAYNEIKDRKGTTINGTFIKDEPKETAQGVDMDTIKAGDIVVRRDKTQCEVIESGKNKDAIYANYLRLKTPNNSIVSQNFTNKGSFYITGFDDYDIVEIIKAN